MNGQNTVTTAMIKLNCQYEPITYTGSLCQYGRTVATVAFILKAIISDMNPRTTKTAY